MGAGKRVLSFGGGGVFGFLIGAGIAKLSASQRGDDLRATIGATIREVKAAGDAAQAAAEHRLISRFRGEVEDPGALEPEAQRAQRLQTRAIESRGAGSLAPAAVAAQNAVHRVESLPVPAGTTDRSRPGGATP